MKILTWNCNMAFRKKYQSVINFDLDLAVIQECEHEEKIRSALEHNHYTDHIWYGKNKHKGIGIFAFNGATLQLMPEFDPQFEYVLPIQYEKEGKVICLFAIWAMPHLTQRAKDYVGQIWGALQHYSHLLSQDCLLIGDFNSNAIWDKKKKMGNHSDVVKLLANHKITSLYHHLNQEEHGKESQPTLYLLKNRNKPYHLDYCFCSKRLISQDCQITVGHYDDWIKLSDHMPLLITLKEYSI